MSLLVPNDGEDRMLQAIVNKTAPENLVLCLFTSNTTPAEADTTATYTEASGFGYAAVNLTPVANWTITPGNPAVASFPQQTFTFTGALGNVYGYYVKQVTSGKLMWAEKFTDGPYNIVNNGDQIKVTPTISLD